MRISGLLALALATLVCLASAQFPPLPGSRREPGPEPKGLELKWLGDTSGQGLPSVELTNAYTSPATAYIMQFEHVDGESVTVINSWPIQAVPRGGTPLEPGQSRIYTANKGPAKSSGANSARVVCTIFADGRTTGDDLCIRRFLDKRRQLLREDIPRVLDILKAAIEQPKIDVKGIMDQMDQVILERSDWAKGQQPFSPLLAEARAYATVKTSLAFLQGRYKDRAYVVETFKKLIAQLESWREDLQASKPELAP